MNVHSASRAIRILGTGAAVPPEVLTSIELDEQLGLPPGTLERRTGVRSRHVERRSAAALGAEAGRRAIDRAGLDLGDIDLVIAASATPDQPLPCNAALLHEQLAPERPIPAWDINASCLGFLVALDVIATLIAAGRYRHVLLVAADVASVGLDWTHLRRPGSSVTTARQRRCSDRPTARTRRFWARYLPRTARVRTRARSRAAVRAIRPAARRGTSCR
jgi:3-oxoacyl-[acyl-carrier-protein] synthase III